MAFLIELWLPIILSSVLVFLASAVLWMALPLHKKDFMPPPDEASIMSAIRTHGFKPGQYYVPWCHEGNWKDESFKAKMKEGPWAMVCVMSAAPSFGRSLVQWFIYSMFISVLIAYAASAALGFHQGTRYLDVFQVVGVVTWLGYSGSTVCDSIWKGVPWRVSLAQVFDGLVYALLTAGTFAWLWPSEIVG